MADLIARGRLEGESETEARAEVERRGKRELETGKPESRIRSEPVPEGAVRRPERDRHKKDTDCLGRLETLYRLQGSRQTHLDNCTERENAKSERSKQRKAKQHSERGLQTFWKVIKLIRAQGGCPGTDCR